MNWEGKFEKGNAEEWGVSEVQRKGQGESSDYSRGEWAEKSVAIVVYKSIVRRN